MLPSINIFSSHHPPLAVKGSSSSEDFSFIELEGGC